MNIYADARIILLKEEGDSSHVNQAYDQKVAKDDKVTMRDCLGYLRQAEKLTKSIISGWDLIHVALAAVRELSPDSWITSFTRVNLHPRFRAAFPEWCQRISHFLEGGANFKPEIVMADTYNLLPSFWRGMALVEKKRCSEILKAHDGGYTVACVRQLISEMHIPIADIQNLRVCLELAEENPVYLEREPSIELEVSLVQPPTAVTAAQTAMADVADGLTSFQLHPTCGGKQLLTGVAKFEHMVKLARRSVSSDVALVPSAYLDITFTGTQRMLLNPTAQDFTMHEIMMHAHGSGAQQALAKRKLDALGNVRGQCGFANDPARLKRLKSQLDLVASIADISKVTSDEKAAANSLRTSGLAELGPLAVAKLKARDLVVADLTKKEICALAFSVFGGVVLVESQAKPILVDHLEKLMVQQPSVIEAALAAAPALPPRARSDTDRNVPGKQPPARKRTRKAVAHSSEEDSDNGDDDDNSDDDDDSDDADDDDDTDNDETAADADSAVDRRYDSSDDEVAAAPGSINRSDNNNNNDTAAPAAPAAAAKRPKVVKLGRIVHVPHSAFPDEDEPENGFWEGKTVRTKAGGPLDVGILIEGEEVFTWPMVEVATWVV